MCIFAIINVIIIICKRGRFPLAFRFAREKRPLVLNEDWQFTKDDVLTMKALDKATRLNEGLPFPIKVVRKLGAEGACYLFGAGEAITDAEKALQFLNSSTRTYGIEKGYLSTSSNYDKNIFKEHNVMLNIYVSANTPLYITKNYNESEILFMRGAKLLNEHVSKDKNRLIIDCHI